MRPSPHQVRLSALGAALARHLGGQAVRATATLATTDGPLSALTTGRIVAKVFTLAQPLLFHTDSVALLQPAESYLVSIARQLAHVPSVTCTGYPDSAGGDDQDDYQLGIRRAATVCSFLTHRAHIHTHLSQGTSTIPGDLDQPQPVLGARLTLTY
jgi:outer membrane protein OmpA-like peptidoglycan-associated protein